MNTNTKYNNSIQRFKEFHSAEVKTILLFLIQVGNKKEYMFNNFVNMQVLNEKICKSKENISFLKELPIYGKRELKYNIKIMKNEQKNYNKYKKILEKYIKNFGKKSDILICFKSMVLYELVIQKMSENVLFN